MYINLSLPLTHRTTSQSEISNHGLRIVCTKCQGRSSQEGADEYSASNTQGFGLKDIDASDLKSIKEQVTIISFHQWRITKKDGNGSDDAFDLVLERGKIL